jgi:hypothetical protein
MIASFAMFAIETVTILRCAWNALRNIVEMPLIARVTVVSKTAQLVTRSNPERSVTAPTRRLATSTISSLRTTTLPNNALLRDGVLEISLVIN